MILCLATWYSVIITAAEEYRPHPLILMALYSSRNYSDKIILQDVFFYTGNFSPVANLLVPILIVDAMIQ